MAVYIDKTAYVDKRAELDDGVKVGRFAYIGPEVKVGKDTEIMQGVIIRKNTVIGKSNKIYPYAIIGEDSQDLKYKGEESCVVIGDENVIREFVTIHVATGEGEKTIIGNRNLLMGHVHIAHNCIIGNEVIMSQAAMLAGHVIVDDYAVIAGKAGVHQFRKIGKYAMVGGMSKITMDVPPFFMVDGNPAKLVGINSVKLNRCGFLKEEIDLAKKVYKLYREKPKLAEVLKEVKSWGRIGEIFVEFFEKWDDVKPMR